MDIVATLGGITLNQTGKAVECMMLVLMIYLIISLLISAFMNWYNRRIALVERCGGGKDMADTTRAYAPGTHPSLPPPTSVSGPLHLARPTRLSSPRHVPPPAPA